MTGAIDISSPSRHDGRRRRRELAESTGVSAGCLGPTGAGRESVFWEEFLMSPVQTDYPENHRPTTTTRPRVDSVFSTSGADQRITFDDSSQARQVADELAKLLCCSPDDFGYGDREGRPIEISIEETIIECALAIAHMRLRLPLPSLPPAEVPDQPPNRDETITLPDGETTVVLRPADQTLEIRRGDVYGSIHIDASQPRPSFSIGIQIGNTGRSLDSYPEPETAFNALIAQVDRAPSVKATRQRKERAEAAERAAIAQRREDAWELLERFGRSLRPQGADGT